MSASYRNITQVKLDIKQIIDNLQTLNHYQGNEANLPHLKCNTEELLNKLENLPLENIKTKLLKRQRKRRNKRLQKLKIFQNHKQIQDNSNNVIVKEDTPPALKESKSKPNHHLLKSVKECQRFLQTFELLQQIHLARGQNSSDTYKFSLKLRQLKSIWNSLLQDKQQEVTTPEAKIEQQWNEVLFGPAEKTYFQDKPDLQNFIRKRQIWDSYIDNKHGTAIPIGWVIPKENANEEWQTYLSPNV
ncbi:uncharacterized protein ACRADG_012195 [Cochliomyia hominivorax]